LELPKIFFKLTWIQNWINLFILISFLSTKNKVINIKLRRSCMRCIILSELWWISLGWIPTHQERIVKVCVIICIVLNLSSHWIVIWIKNFIKILAKSTLLKVWNILAILNLTRSIYYILLKPRIFIFALTFLLDFNRRTLFIFLSFYE